MPSRFEDGDLSERLTVRFDEELVDELDKLIESSQYPSRSAVLREAAERFLNEQMLTDGGEDL